MRGLRFRCLFNKQYWRLWRPGKNERSWVFRCDSLGSLWQPLTVSAYNNNCESKRLNTLAERKAIRANKLDGTMNLLRIPLRVVFYQEEDDWIAHCLEFDLIGDGPTHQEALECLNEAIRLQIIASLENDNIDNLFSPAKPKYHQMFAAGHDVAYGDWEIKDGDVEIQEICQREYDEGKLALN